MRIHRPLLATCIIALAAWVLCGLLVAPRVLASAYAERSLTVLNRVLSGRDTHPLPFYLDVWNRAFALITVVLIVTALMVALVPWQRVKRGAVEALRTTMQRRISAGHALLIACAFGLVMGFLEALAHVIVSVGLDRPRWGSAGQFYTDGLLWMAPIANTMGYAALALVLILVTRWKLRTLPLRPWLMLLGGLGVYGILRSLITGLHPLAVLLVSAGVGLELARALEGRLPRLVRPASRAVVVGALACAGLGLTGAVMQRVPSIGRPAQKRWNVLLLVLDTQRASNLGVYGHFRNTTPNIDAFARDAVVFEHAVAPAPWTLASHASFFTGRWPSELSTSWNVRLDDTYPTVAELFRERGYATGGFVANEIYTSPRSGLGRGFQVYRGDQKSVVILLKNSWFTRNLMMRILDDPDHTWGRKNAEDVRGEFTDWLDDIEGAPFFAFLNFMDTHSPYPAPSPYDTMYAGRFIETRPHMAERFNYDGQHLSSFADAYDQALTYLDAEIGKLFAQLSERGLLDSTVVIITADHGEQLGERKPQLILHGNSLYYSVLHVPLIVRHPGDPAARGRIATPVSLRDLPATALAMAGLPSTRQMPGASLDALWRAGGRAQVSPAIAQLTPLGKDEKRWKHWAQAVLAGEHHYILNGTGSEELYDITADPWERTDIARQRPQVIDSLRRVVQRTARR
jgi:arylsulfatase A-like enzyme